MAILAFNWSVRGLYALQHDGRAWLAAYSDRKQTPTQVTNAGGVGMGMEGNGIETPLPLAFMFSLAGK